MKNLNMNVKTLLIAAAVSAGGLLYAQNVEEEIELPDVTTVISGGAFTAGKDSVPDYRQIIPETDSPKIQLPSMEKPKTESISVKDRSDSLSKEKDIYAEGELGAGYPFCFTGDFSVYRASGNTPFAIDFSHESSEGFAAEKASEGYFYRNTRVAGKNGFYNETNRHDFYAEYKTSDDGLQLNSKYFTDIVKHNINLGFDSIWNFRNGLYLDYGAKGDWFSRYGQLSSEEVFENSPVSKDNYISETSSLVLSPSFKIGWSGKGFDAFFRTCYDCQLNLKKSNGLVKAEGSSNSDSSHRGKFTLGGSWHDDELKVFADGSVIVGTATGSKNVVPAFTLGLDYETDWIEGQALSIGVRGGLDSYQEKISILENLYKYSVSCAIPVETTDWFAELEVTVPVTAFAQVNAGMNFKKTAFDNGFWQADYSENLSEFGIYLISPEDRTLFNTTLGGSLDLNNVKLSASWNACWMDLPVLEEKQVISAAASYQPESTKWNAGLSSKFAFGGEADKCPDISAWAGIKLASALSVAFRLNDTVKLFTRESRKFAHSEYIQKGGSAVLLVKFQF